MNPFNQQHTQTSITFHVQAVQGSHFRATPLRYSPPAHLLHLWHARHRGSRHPPTHLLPPQSQPRHKADHCQPFVVARRGRPSVRVPDPTLCDPALSPFASQPPEPLQRYTLARECGGASHSTTVCFAMHDHRLTLQLHDNRLTCCESSGWLSSTDQTRLLLLAGFLPLIHELPGFSEV